MNNSLKLWTVLLVLASSALIMGQGGGGCGFSNEAPDPLAPLVEEPDPLAPLVEDPDPLAPLAPEGPVDPLFPRGKCALWSGKFSGTRHHTSSLETGCPWLDGTVDVETDTTTEQHVSEYQMTFRDAWGADNWGTICAPDGASAKPIRTTGGVTYTKAYTYDHDWGDSCRSHRSTSDDTFTFDVSGDDIYMLIEVYPQPFSEADQEALLEERPCRQEYPVKVTLILSAPDSGGSGTHNWYDRSTDNCAACDGCPIPGSLETNGTDHVTTNSGAAYRAELYGTYRIDSYGRDTIEARLQVSTDFNPNRDGEGQCAGVNDDCSCDYQDQVIEDYVLTLNRIPEGNRDLDLDCDSIDPCPDAPYTDDCGG